MAGVDLELKKAFSDLQTKMVTTQQLLKNHDAQIGIISKDIDSSKITGEVISSLPPETNVFESVGRMFVKHRLPEVQEHLDLQVEEMTDKIKKLESNKDYLARNLKESEDNLREMVAQKQKARTWKIRVKRDKLVSGIIGVWQGVAMDSLISS